MKGHSWVANGFGSEKICEKCRKVVSGETWFTSSNVLIYNEECMGPPPTRTKIFSATSPLHYVAEVEPIDAIEAWGLGFRLANVVKYVARAGKKPGVDASDDLCKARAYLSREIAALEGRRSWE